MPNPDLREKLMSILYSFGSNMTANTYTPNYMRGMTSEEAVDAIIKLVLESLPEESGVKIIDIYSYEKGYDDAIKQMKEKWL